MPLRDECLVTCSDFRALDLASFHTTTLIHLPRPHPPWQFQLSTGTQQLPLAYKHRRTPASTLAPLPSSNDPPRFVLQPVPFECIYRSCLLQRRLGTIKLGFLDSRISRGSNARPK